MIRRKVRRFRRQFSMLTFHQQMMLSLRAFDLWASRNGLARL